MRAVESAPAVSISSAISAAPARSFAAAPPLNFSSFSRSEITVSRSLNGPTFTIGRPQATKIETARTFQPRLQSADNFKPSSNRGIFDLPKLDLSPSRPEPRINFLTIGQASKPPSLDQKPGFDFFSLYQAGPYRLSRLVRSQALKIVESTRHSPAFEATQAIDAAQSLIEAAVSRAKRPKSKNILAEANEVLIEAQKVEQKLPQQENEQLHAEDKSTEDTQEHEASTSADARGVEASEAVAEAGEIVSEISSQVSAPSTGSGGKIALQESPVPVSSINKASQLSRIQAELVSTQTLIKEEKAILQSQEVQTQKAQRKGEEEAREDGSGTKLIAQLDRETAEARARYALEQVKKQSAKDRTSLIDLSEIASKMPAETRFISKAVRQRGEAYDGTFFDFGSTLTNVGETSLNIAEATIYYASVVHKPAMFTDQLTDHPLKEEELRRVFRRSVVLDLNPAAETRRKVSILEAREQLLTARLTQDSRSATIPNTSSGGKDRRKF